MSERPHSRKRNDSGKTAQAQKRGEGLSSSQSPKRSSAVTRGGGVSLLALLVAAFMFFNGGLGGSSDTTTTNQTTTNQSGGSALQSLINYGSQTTNNVSYTNASSNNINTSVASGSRQKYTQLLGNGNDQVTVLVYMCGTDLESNYGMATADINEMALATHSDKVNIVIETGGTKRWKNNVITAGTNQLWLVQDRSLYALNKNLGRAAMTDSNTLAEFIRYGVQNFPANRYILIFWDHGGGSLSGYGYDELYPNSSMTVDKIAAGLKAAGQQFDIIGFDACLMANMETALAVEPYADYLLASEETEPGTGWYYTDWVTLLSQNSSVSSLELGKKIIDDFCTKTQSGSSSSDKNTLSLVDLAEFKNTVPSALSTFSRSITSAVQNNNYQSVADARSVTREFAQSQSLDQIDLVHFCDTLNTTESKALSNALKSCVKYNRTRNVSNAYGLSIYFPYRNTRRVNTALQIYNNIGFNSEYSSALKSFANLQASGQAVSYGTSSSLFDLLGGSSASNGTSYGSLDLSSLLGYGGQSSSGLDLSSLLGGSSAVDSSAFDLISAFLGRSHIDSSDLVLTEKNGYEVLSLSEEDWSLVQDIRLNVWVDDGSGYIDLGEDNIFEFDEDGDLIVDYDNMWLAVDGELISYKMTSVDKADDGTWLTIGYAPILLNGEEANLIIEFSGEDEVGHVVGVEMKYDGVETDGKLIPYINDGEALYDEETICLKAGDAIDFICDYYTYDGTYDDRYLMGNTVYVGEDMVVEDVTVTNSHKLFGYILQDIYGTQRHTPMVEYSK